MSNHFIKPANIARSFARSSGMTPASDLKPASWITAEMDLSTGENHIHGSLPTPNDMATEVLTDDELMGYMQEAVKWDMDRRNRFPELRPKEIAKMLEKPYKPLVDFRHYGQNSHWSGRGQR